MKKIVVVLIALLSITTSKADKIGFTYTAGTDLVSTYLWRGLNLGGLSLQPELAVGYGGLSLDVWGNIGADDWLHWGINPEIDISLEFSRWGITLGATQQYYFDGTKFFEFKEIDPEENGNVTEVYAGINVGEWAEMVPLSITWYTQILGGDGYIKDGEMKRAYSSYVEVGWEQELPLGFELDAYVGMTPWKSLYTNYEGNFAVNNVSLRLNKAFNIDDIVEIDVFAQGMVNTYGIDKDNLIVKIKDRDDELFSHMNGVIGCGIWF